MLKKEIDKIETNYGLFFILQGGSMYNFTKLKGEETKFISDDAHLKMDKEFKNISVILTNKRLILLDYPNGVNNYEEALRVSRNVNYIREKEPILSIKLSEIDHIENDEIDKYVLKSGDYFYLECSNLRKQLH